MGLTPAQVRARVDRGVLPGGAEPRPRRARYYVYSDVPPLLAGPRGPAGSGADTAALYARVQALETANLLLLASEAALREAAAAATRAEAHLRAAESARAEEGRQVRVADAAKADALSALLVPGDAGGLAH